MKEKKTKAELWDRVHYIMRDYWDGMIRGILYYEGAPDRNLMIRTVLYLLKSVPVLHSRYHNHLICPYWKEEEININEVLHFSTAKDIVNASYQYVSKTIPPDRPAQVQIGVIQGEDSFSVCFLCSHMCCDGGDFKYLVHSFNRIYTALAMEKPCPVLKNGSRKYDEMYSGLNRISKEEAKRLYVNVSAAKKGKSLPFARKEKKESPIFVQRVLNEKEFLCLKEKCGREDVTVNDVLQATFAETVYEFAGIPSEKGIQISCMCDLRKKMADAGNTTGITNHTGFLTCKINRKPHDTEETVKTVHEVMDKQKNDPYAGMYGIPLLKLVQTVLPEFLAALIIRIGYKSPLYSVSNLGVLKQEEYCLGENAPYDVYMTGTVKYKPAIQLSAVTMCNRLHMTFAVKGSKYDWVLLSEMLDAVKEKVCRYAVSQ